MNLETIKSASPEVITGRVFVNLGEVEIEHGKRYLLTITDDGSPRIDEIPMFAAIATQERYLEMMTEGNGTYVPTERLVAFVEAATEKLKQRGAL